MSGGGRGEVALTLPGIYLFGYGLGGMITGPFSEVFGRNPIYIFSLTMLCLFEMGSGLSSTIGTHIACRFVSGFFASVTVVGSGGSLNDIWSPIQRVWAFPIYASATYIGTIVGIVPSSLIGTSLSWARHWVSWIDIILAASLLVFVLLFQPETYAPSLMRWKARHLRRLTGDNRYRAPVEQTEVSFSSRLAHALYRPVIFMIREPIVGLVSLYLALIFIVLYTFLAGYIYIFVKLYHLSPALVGALAQSTSVGVAISWLTVPLAMKCVQRDVALASSRGHSRPPPEISLYMAMFGAPAIPISLFWLGWTARPSISPWSALGASALFGYGSICVIISMLQYIADTFEFYAASAMGTVSLVRFAAAGGVVTVSFPFYENLGVGDTLTILACLSFAMLPMPYIFYKFGHHIRRLSIYAVR
ncbi:hypothetical protein ASPZODRAFT_131020 [Penicilliopsis zonata CBS 506.65]|uniref:Major facilitator superfamily (MFS) profile domain-containing protein n=1 Tax=Penicilliopsis zonata CBS 506.65 TaxID=1073090 RepID=A0A1L9SK91_9EURO|nr:hypothetical protein ASPZODRAFT_131020 [Penicilliopsis zonata CBS 506.65]OJJ47513.1 hypothetical protein ASPZODRAFT_131020 [Penicilliopsis zonata CBS 506.65]